MRAHGRRQVREGGREYVSRREDSGEAATWSEMFPVAGHGVRPGGELGGMAGPMAGGPHALGGAWLCLGSQES